MKVIYSLESIQFNVFDLNHMSYDARVSVCDS